MKLHRELTPTEVKEFEQRVKDNFDPTTKIDSTWHPVFLREWVKLLDIHYNEEETNPLAESPLLVIPISLVFDDLRRLGESIPTEEYNVHTAGNLHSGSTFPGTIVLDEEDAEFFDQMLVSGLQVVFWTSTDQ